MGATATADENIHQGEAAEHLPPRLRLERLLDPATAFLEIGRQPGDDAAPLVGIGRVAERLAVLVVEGATPVPAKVGRAQEIARSCHLPLLYLLEDGSTMEDPALVQQQACLTVAGLPAIALFFAPPAPAGVQLAALADESMATGAAELADHVALDDAHALFLLRQAVTLLPATTGPTLPDPLPGPPAPDLLTSLFDEGHLPRFRPGSTCELGFAHILGFAHVGGLPLGVMVHGKEAPADADMADMAAFLELSHARQLPLLEIGRLALPPPASNAAARGQAALQKAWAAFAAGGTLRITLLPEGAPPAADSFGGYSGRHGPFFCWALGEGTTKAQDGFLTVEEARPVVALLLAACHQKGGNPG